MKKILAIAPYPYLPYYSGGQKFIAQFFDYLGRETDLTVITVATNDFSLATFYKTIPLLKKSFARYFDRSLVNKIARLIKEHNYDTLIIEHPYMAWLAFALRKTTGIKVIIHTHNIEYQRFRSTGKWWWPVLKWYEKYSFKKADAIFFITTADKAFAINEWKIPAAKCIDLPYGIEISNYPTDKESCRQIINTKHQIPPAEKILLFAGAFNYKPNLDALKIILDNINPLLQQSTSFSYKIIICGKGLPDELDLLKEYAGKNIIYAGFIPDIDTYYKAADIFLNPVLTGGGVKTKVVEAIAYGTTVISTESGAIGIEKNVCGEKLITIPDKQWTAFSEMIIQQSKKELQTPPGYYQYYYWVNIIKTIAVL